MTSLSVKKAASIIRLFSFSGEILESDTFTLRTFLVLAQKSHTFIGRLFQEGYLEIEARLALRENHVEIVLIIVRFSDSFSILVIYIR